MRSRDPKRRSTYLMIRMRPPWVFIDEIRRFVQSFCAVACPGHDREEQVALAVHELMQNAIRASDGEDVDLALEVDPDGDRIHVRVTNSCSEAEYRDLCARIERMNGERDALAHYLRAMAEAPAQTRGGLGLARVRFEAQLELEATRDGDYVTIHASGRLRAPLPEISGVNHG
jgi:anti-sigma regulatory factor (Ser/Thr protein kinase)